MFVPSATQAHTHLVLVSLPVHHAPLEQCNLLLRQLHAINVHLEIMYLFTGLRYAQIAQLVPTNLILGNHFV